MQISHRETFTTIRTEGSLLPADLLQRIADGKEIDGLNPSDYHLSGRLNEAINRSWNYLLATWTAFQTTISQLPEKDLGTGITREKWLLPLFQELGYGRLLVTKAVEIEGKSYPISHSWHHVPIHLVGFRLSIDKKVPGAVGAAKMSPHGLMQEYLNRSNEHLWGFVSNGFRLRILRDTVSLTKQSYIEFDIEGMMNGEVYSDFVIFWLLCHESRLEADKPEDCWLEKWSKGAQEEGTRALDQLRSGVEKAIEALGRGFLANTANTELRDRLRTGILDKQDYYRQILRLVYRLILLFVAEDRGILLDPKAAPAEMERYSRFYSLARIRKLAEKKIGTRHSDLYQAVKLVMEKLGSDHECVELGLAPLGSFLFSSDSIKEIGGCSISNRDLLDAIRSLTFITYDHSRRPVDYKHIGSEELGSVYESLLEQHPEINIAAGEFSLQTASGHERKTTGSYYTPSSLVKCLLDSALDPVLEKAVREKNPEEAILNLKVCDPASGSGHFLVAAAHRIAKRLAATRTGDDEPSPASVRKALRDVVGRCLYGVDLNPMAVELCKVSLWMEAMEPGKPLSFLDHHIKCGNSLIGTTPKLISEGIPDEAFTPVEGDDKGWTSALKKRNKQERPAKKGSLGQTTFHSLCKGIDQTGLTKTLNELNLMDDDSIVTLQRKEFKYKALISSQEYQRTKLIADAWCTAFVWKKQKDAPPRITHDIFRRITANPETLSDATLNEVHRLSEQYSLFHWHVAFPDVFGSSVGGKTINKDAGWDGGFDVILGNPPWEQLQLDAREYFVKRVKSIAQAKHTSEREKAIQALRVTNPDIYVEFLEEKRKNESVQQFIHSAGKYPFTNYGRLNSAPLFTELSVQLMNPYGRVGLIVPTGIATDSFNQFFFQYILRNKLLVSLYDFENRQGIFKNVQGNMKFCLLTLANDGPDEFLVSAQLESPSLIGAPERLYMLSASDISRINPNTCNCPTLRTKDDFHIIADIHKRVPVLVKESDGDKGNTWGFQGQLMFMMNTASKMFATHEQLEADRWTLIGNCYIKNDDSYLPLYEAKLMNQYNHRASTFLNLLMANRFNTHAGTLSVESTNLSNPDFAIIPRYWIPQSAVKERLGSFNWVLGFRDIISAVADSRSLISAILPPYGVGNTVPLIGTSHGAEGACIILSMLNSIVLDYVLRQKASGGHVNFYILKQLPILPFSSFSSSCEWDDLHSRLHWIKIRVLELTYTAWDMEPFAKDCGYNGPPLRWDDDRRFLLRCELDAAYFHFYGLERDGVDHIIETFPIVKRRDEQQYGEYRIKRVILEIFDAMAEAIRSGKPFQTRLDPPPADPSVAHSAKTSAKKADVVGTEII